MTKKRIISGNVLGGLVVGWESIEPMLLGCVAARLNLILRGLHGAAKTVFAKLVAEAIDGQYRHYDATKDDMVSVAGIPNPQALAEGRFEFSKHGRTIWDALIISVDELTRAPKETQNMWLEIFEEKKCYGFDLNYQMAIATMNPSTYSATYRLDEALLDRFAAVVEIPNILAGDGNSVATNTAEVIDMNKDGRGKRDDSYLKALSSAINRIRAQFDYFKHSEDVVNNVKNYVAQFMRELSNETKVRNDDYNSRSEFYISPRRMVLLYESIIACAAYYKFAQSLGMIVPKEGMFVEAANMATMFVVASPLNLDPKIVLGCHNKVKGILIGVIGCESDKLRKEIQDSGTIAEKIQKMEAALDIVVSWTPAEIGSIIQILTEEVFDSVAPKIKDIQSNTTSLLSDCQGIDSLTALFLKMENHPDISIKVAGKNACDGAKGRIVDLMLNIAREYGKKSSKDRTYICTYKRIQNLLETNKNIAQIWQGHLVNNSVAKTIKTILQKA